MVYSSEPVDEILWCDHSSESQRAVLPCGTVYKVFLTFVSVDENLSCDDSNETSSAALLYGASYWWIVNSNESQEFLK